MRPAWARQIYTEFLDRMHMTRRCTTNAGRSICCQGRLFLARPGSRLGLGHAPGHALALLLVLVPVMLLSAGLSAVAAGDEGSCSPCHDLILSSWAGSPHQLAGASSKFGFRCQECHPKGLFHPKTFVPDDATERCGRCHFPLAEGKTREKAKSIRPVVLLDREAWTQDKHNRAKIGCVSCHSVHRYAEGADQHLLRLSGDELCRSCHGDVRHRSSSGVAEGVAKLPCVNCHDPHRSTGSMLDTQSGGGKRDFKKAYVHRPVAESKCAACHSAHIAGMGATQPAEDDDDQPAVEGAGPQPGSSRFKGLLLSPGRVFCYLCHGTFEAKFEASGHARVSQLKRGEEQSPCLGCHLPHASEYRKLTRYPGNQLCLACHPGYAPHHFLARGGVKQSQLQCTRCHSPHGSGNRRLLVQTDVCKLCHSM